MTKDNINDPYIFEKLDPNESRASESCLWEIEMLKNHYCPTVAVMAKIFQDSLAKPSYDLEDFFDHSYASLIDSEIKTLKDAALSIKGEAKSNTDTLWTFFAKESEA